MQEIEKEFAELVTPVIEWLRKNKPEGTVIVVEHGFANMLSPELDEDVFIELEN